MNDIFDLGGQLPKFLNLHLEQCFELQLTVEFFHTCVLNLVLELYSTLCMLSLSFGSALCMLACSFDSALCMLARSFDFALYMLARSFDSAL